MLVSPVVLDWIERNGGEDDWFLHVNYWDPHTPYRAPAEFGNPFADEPLVDWPDEKAVKEHQQAVGPHCAREIMMYDSDDDPEFPRHPGEVANMAQFREMIDGYDCGIRYMDDHIGRLFEALEKKDVLEDMVVIISADHGENFGEFGIYGEHATADYPTCRIPMVISWPGRTKPGVDSRLHYNLDLLPTLAEMLGEQAQPDWDGKSYAKTLTDGIDCGQDYLVLSQCAHVCQRSVRFDDYIYIRTYHDGYHLFADEMLFDLKVDPYQQNNLSEQNPELCHKAVYYLNQWHDEMMFTMDSQIDPLWTVINEGGPEHARGRLGEYCKRLEKTGRSWAVPILKEKHPGEF